MIYRDITSASPHITPISPIYHIDIHAAMLHHFCVFKARAASLWKVHTRAKTESYDPRRVKESDWDHPWGVCDRSRPTDIPHLHQWYFSDMMVVWYLRYTSDISWYMMIYCDTSWYIVIFMPISCDIAWYGVFCAKNRDILAIYLWYFVIWVFLQNITDMGAYHSGGCQDIT